MIRFAVLAVLLTAAVGAGPAQADDDDWAGFYVGIDDADGSVDRLSIVPIGDATFNIRVVLSKASLCAGGETGLIVGTGRIEDDKLVRRDAILRCGDTEGRAIEDRTYTRDDDTGILTIKAGDDGRSLFYHRISDD